VLCHCKITKKKNPLVIHSVSKVNYDDYEADRRANKDNKKKKEKKEREAGTFRLILGDYFIYHWYFC